MRKTSGLINYVLLVIIVLLLLAGGYYLYDKYGSRSINPEDALPASTIAYAVIDRPGALVRDLSEDNAIWFDLFSAEGTGSFLEDLVKADSMLSADGFSELLDEGRVFLVLAGDSAGPETCLMFNWPYGVSESRIGITFSEMAETKLRRSPARFGYIDGFTLSDSSGAVAHYFIHKGLCVIGNAERIMGDCAGRIDSREPLPFDRLYRKVAATAGRNVNANIYINFSRLPQLSGYIFNPSFMEGRQLLPAFAAWSEIDLLIKNDELLMNGYTEAADSLSHFLSLFRMQEPQKIEITRILPYNTYLLLDIGFDKFGDFHRDYAAFMDREEVFPEREGRLSDLKARFGSRLEEYMTSWVGKEMALAVINPHLNDAGPNTFLAVHAADIDQAMRYLGELSSSQYTTQYRDYTIRRITIPDLVSLVYGRMFSGIEHNYYARIEDYIVFANSSASLENFINIFLSGKTLKQNENFKQFTDNVSDRSNIFCYFNIRNAAGMLPGMLKGPLGDFFRDNHALASNFEAVAVQFKALNNMFFTSLYVRHNPDYIQEDLSIWKAYLDAPVYGQPYFVKDHRTNDLMIVAFDTLNNMYLIDHDGNIAWKLNIGERVISDVHTVDFYKNGKIQYLFNTENRIYLIDLLGRDVEGYPVILRKKATNGLAVFDYDNNRDYRIMLALDDNRVYNFDIRGKKVDGWKDPLSKARVGRPVQHLREGGRDYIVITDSEGNVKITDRRGNARINLKDDFVNGLHSEFYVNETNSKGILLTTDAEGTLTYIKANGRIETTDFGDFSREHYFLYEDFDNRGGKDFIFLDGNKLTVYDRFKNVMFAWEFENEIRSTPVIIPVSAREKIIGIVSGATGKIYLFDRQGNLLSTPDHVGKTQLLIGSIRRDGQLNMIVGSGNTIYNYYFR